MKLYEMLCVSALAPDTPVTAVSDIVTGARRHNLASDITGLLVFDGTRFAQLLEGARDSVFQMIEHVRSDARLVNVETLYCERTQERRFNRFTAGFVPVEHEDALGELATREGPAALQQFLALIPVLDLH